MDRVVVCQGQLITTADALLMPTDSMVEGQEFLAAVLTAALNPGEPVAITGNAADTFGNNVGFEDIIRKITRLMNCRYTLDMVIDSKTLITKSCTLTIVRL